MGKKIITQIYQRIRISVTYGKPVGNGIITAYNRNQALKRSGRNNKGLEAAKAVLSILKNEPKRI